MRYMLKKAAEKPFLYSINNIVTLVNKDFLNLTGFSEHEFIGKSLMEVSYMLKIDSQVYLENIESEYSCYMFTKENEAREVTISCKRLKSQNEKKYFIKEKPNISVKERFDFIEQLYTDRKTGVAIRSVPDLILLKVNQNYMDFLEEPFNKIENIIGKKQEKIINEYKSSTAEGLYNTVISTGKPYYVKEFQYNSCKRETTYWDLSIVPIYVQGKIKYLIETILNVTEKVLSRKSIEKQADVIKQQEEKLKVITENMSDALVVFDKDSKFTEFNKFIRNTFFFKISALKNIEDGFEKFKCYDEDGNLILKENSITERVFQGEKISEYKMTVKVNNTLMYIVVSGAPIYNSKGDFIEGILIARDVTNEVKSEETLLIKTKLDLLDNIIRNIDIGVAQYSYPEFKIIDMNNKAYNDLKQINPEAGSLSSLKGKNYCDMYKINEKVKATEIIENLIEKKNGSYFSYRKFIMAGKEKFVKLIHQPLFGLNNQIVEMTVIAIDITDEVKAKNKMKEALKMQEEIFTNVSHELKTPLNVIFSTNQLMEFYLKNNLFEANIEKVARSINSIKQNCYRFTKLINNIVDLSKIETGFFKLDLSNENIVEITEDIVQSVAEYVKSKGLYIVFDTDIEEKIIACDPEKIERIILNLISNAIKFSNPEGKIFVNILDKADTVEISVKDTGIGIDKKYLNNIFGRFQQVDKSLTRNAEGCGIGLSLVKSIVEMHGGKITVDSKVGVGSVFKIELPARTAENVKVIKQTKIMNNKIDMINVEFSDIYSI
ncbi:MAG: ATP-binding protein [Clostridium sp.]|uniref:ATP-binding protein n=1 Tax=Clostridium sp. TaxID=1506 RepID=UPI0039ED9B72